MKINGQITMLISGDGMHIEIHDKASGICFIRANITAKQMGQAFGRLAQTNMQKCDVYNLDKVGKKMEMDTIEFCIGNPDYNERKEVAASYSLDFCDDGWEADNYYGSQDSFFIRDGEQWARTTIRRWV